MVAYSTFRGHKVISHNGIDWLYEDTSTDFDDSRPCPLCGELPTMEGYDPCLGFLPDCESACCGHGVEEPYYIYEE